MVKSQDLGGMNVPGKSCWRCGRALKPEERRQQDGVTVCPDCLYTINKVDYERQVEREWPELRGPLIIGGRTG